MPGMDDCCSYQHMASMTICKPAAASYSIPFMFRHFSDFKNQHSVTLTPESSFLAGSRF